MNTTEQLLTISQAATIAGTTASQLAIWERRYGWPKPSHDRRFTPSEAELIAKVVRRRNSGVPIGRILVDGSPHLLPAVPKPEHPDIDISHLPSPTTADGIATQRALLLGIVQRHPGRIRLAVAMCARLHPSERGPAVLLILDAFRRQHPDHAWLDQILEA